ncbi:MAG: quinone-dependent dihydroorotate dehydrogenase [Myxococcales bacterium]|nr:quinone-dependent dihydroorotate dehydrogenase [Myxococcales bacterium]
MSVYPYIYDLVISRFDAERSHQAALKLLRAAQQTPGGLASLELFAAPSDMRLQVECFGLRFQNPLGVAAGLDKNADAVDALLALGFGHVEIGTVTPRPQPGNPRPRVWRVPEQGAVINALGFPSAGAEAACARLRQRSERTVVGVNIGKNKDTALERAVEDYEACARALAALGDYLTVNVSSPNTPGLRELQHGEMLAEIVRRTRVAAGADGPPLLVKLAPDLSDAELERIATVAVDAGAAGIVATNTTIARDGLPAQYQEHPGGLSGAPLRARATEVCRRLYRDVGSRVPIVGVGGIASADDVLERVRAGASLVQLYTAFIFRGPGMAGQLVRDLSAAADREGWRSVSELVGVDA